MPFRIQLNPVQIIIAFFWYIPITLLVYIHIIRNRRYAWTHRLKERAFVLLPLYDYFIYYDFIKYLLRFIFFGFIHDWTADVLSAFDDLTWAECICVVLATDLGEVIELSFLLHFLLGKSSGRRAVLKSLKFTAIFASIYFTLRVSTYKFSESDTFYILSVCCSLIMVVFLIGCIIRMCKYHFSRWSNTLYTYVCLYTCLWSLIILSSIFGLYKLQSGVMILVAFLFAFDFFIPLLRYKVLIEDSQYWRSFKSHLLPDRPDHERSLLQNDHLQNSPQLSGLRDIKTGSSSATDILSLLQVPIIDYTSLQSSHEFLGMGGSAIVWKGLVNGNDVAVKELLNRDLNFWDLTKFCREVLLSTSLQHENIVGFHGIVICPPCIFLIYDWCNCGDLDKYLTSVDEKKASLNLAKRFHFAVQAARGLEFFHSRGYVHRDIKPQNFLVHQDGGHTIIKIADFGSARSKHDEGHILSGITPVFTPPELHKKFSSDFIKFGIQGGLQNVVVQYGPEMDIYSFGWILCRIMFDPFKEFKDSQLKSAQIFERVQSGWLPEVRSLDEKYQEIVKLCFRREPWQRPTAEQVRSLLELRAENKYKGCLMFEISA